MFEAITTANADDYQSLEILKEAYWKIGRQADAISVSRKLADAYKRLGQFSSAMLEYEGILQQEPDSEEVKAALEELEVKFGKGSSAKAASIALDFGIEEETAAPAAPQGFAPAPAAAATASPLSLVRDAAPASSADPNDPASLIATAATKMPRNLVRGQTNLSLDHDGNEPLAKFLIQHRLVTHEVVNTALEKVRAFNCAPEVKAGERIAASLLFEIGKAGTDLESLLSGIIDRTKFAYAPLENYDVDRQIVKMLPENLTLGRLVVPFDIVSRTMMVAVDNPFDAGAKAAVQQAVDYHIQWHLALPHVIHKILRGVYRLSE